MNDQPRRCCDTCCKRAPWTQEQFARRIVTIAECMHRPLPPFWHEHGPLQVMPGCGTQCISWVPATPQETPNA